MSRDLPPLSLARISNSAREILCAHSAEGANPLQASSLRSPASFGTTEAHRFSLPAKRRYDSLHPKRYMGSMKSHWLFEEGAGLVREARPVRCEVSFQ